jgi:hypothetical protein
MERNELEKYYCMRNQNMKTIYNIRKGDYYETI